MATFPPPVVYGLRAPFPVLRGHVRHVRPVWLLEELGVPYDLRFLNMETSEEDAPAYLAVNPFGKVPALHDGDFRLFESGAICSYLAEKHGRLIPAAGTPERARHDQWMYVAVAMVEPHTSRLLAVTAFHAGDPGGPVLRAAALEALQGTLGVLDAHLGRNAYLTGPDFAVADVMMTATLRLAEHADVFAPFPAIRAYLEKNAARPAFRRAVELQ